MNGRVYDYNLGRFLSVDPFIQGAENTQSINPYSYILNNPMAGTDPTGYLRVCDTFIVCSQDQVQDDNFNKPIRLGGSDNSSNGQQNENKSSGSKDTADIGSQQNIAKIDTTEQVIGGQQGLTATGDYITPEGVHDFGTGEVDGHTYNITATFGKLNNDSGGNPYSLPENMVTVAGLAAGVAEHGKHPYWLAGNGKIYPSSWGGNQHTGGKNKAIAKAKGLAAKLGKGLFFTYAGVRAVDAIDKITTMRTSGDMDGIRSEAIDAGLDVAIGAIGVWGGPVGWGIAGAYWLADEFVFDGNFAKGVSQWFRREEEYSQ